MQNPKPLRILFITHEASLGGAPLLLLRLIHILKEDGFVVNTLVMQTGPLQQAFEDVSAVCAVYKKPQKKNIASKIKRRVLGSTNDFNIKPLIAGVDIVFSNTIINGTILHSIKQQYKGPVISYIHELETVTALCTNEYTLRRLLHATDFYCSPCKAVDNFLSVLEVNPQIIARLNYYTPPVNKTTAAIQESFTHNKLITASFIIGSLGTLEWRKGADIFLQAAALFFEKKPTADVQFIWMGKADSKEQLKFQHDVRKLGLEKKKVILIEGAADVQPFFDTVDVLLLPSREDPYPVVVLEAACNHIPVICFDKAGGTPEFACAGAGSIVPYLDIQAMLSAIIAYYKDRQLLTAHAAMAFNKVSVQHQSKELIKEQFHHVLKLVC